MKKFLLLFLISTLLIGNKAFSQTIVSAPYYPMCNWDTSPYKSFKLTGGVANPTYDMPFRLLYPKGYEATTVSTVKYPLVVMLHGGGESALGNAKFGIYYSGDPRRYNNDHQLLHHGKEYLSAVNTGRWPGFVLFPQNPYGDWVDSPGKLADAAEIIETLIKTLKIDPNRIYVTGLSAGANGVWGALARYTTLFAAGMAFSGISPPSTSNTTKIAEIPLWYFQGEIDPNPTKYTADQTIKALRNVGGTPTYTVYPETGHGTWGYAIAERDFFTFMLRHSKLSIHAFYGKTEFNVGETVNVKLGITPGFAGYEWRKNGLLISGATTHQITATSLGSYTVRFKRGTVWTPWSDPLILRLKTPPSIVSQPLSLTKTSGSLVTFSVSSIGTAPLTYQWQKNGVNISGATSDTYSIWNAQSSHAGDYRVIVSNVLGKATSNIAKLIITPGPVVNIISPTEGTQYKGGQTISYSGSGKDATGNTIPSSGFSWKLEFHKPASVTSIWTKNGSKTGSFSIPTSGEPSPNVFYRLFLTVKDSRGIKSTMYRDIKPFTTKITMVTQPAGLKVKVDGLIYKTPYSFIGVEGRTRSIGIVSPQSYGGTNYKFSKWNHGGTATQTIVVPTSDITYTAVYAVSTARIAYLEDQTTVEREAVIIFPNPANDFVTVSVESVEGERLNVSIINSMGMIIKSKDFVADSDGIHSVYFDVNKLDRNSFVVKVQKGKDFFYKHLIVNR